MWNFKSDSWCLESRPSVVYICVPSSHDERGKKVLTYQIQHSPTDKHLSDICCCDFNGRGCRDACWTFQALAMVIMSLDGVGCSRGTVFYSCYHLLCILWSQVELLCVHI